MAPPRLRHQHRKPRQVRTRERCSRSGRQCVTSVARWYTESMPNADAGCYAPVTTRVGDHFAAAASVASSLNPIPHRRRHLYHPPQRLLWPLRFRVYCAINSFGGEICCCSIFLCCNEGCKQHTLVREDNVSFKSLYVILLLVFLIPNTVLCKETENVCSC